jgi:diguanylate cyclase (GGDEF)-like protein/PAS domain S-box-containing protein
MLTVDLESALPVAPATAGPGLRGKVRVLIVEDEAVIALDLAQQLRSFGYEVVGIASSGRRAMELTAAQQPDLIMMDIVIKGSQDGVETARRIHTEFDVPVVFLTAYGDAGTVERVKQVAPHGFLIKPFRPADLRNAIEVALVRHGLEKQQGATVRWLTSTLQGLSDAVIATDEQGRVQFMNPMSERLLGCRGDQVLNTPVSELAALFDAQGGEPLADLAARALASGRPTAPETGTMRGRPDVEPLTIEVQASPVRDGQRVLGAVLVLRDITERRRTEAAQARLTRIDALTGLPNRAALQPQIEAMAASALRLGSTLGVMFLDLDGFKQVNDSFGHHVGDAVLVEVARRLKEAVRVEDFVARLGGDEFVVLAGNLAQSNSASTVADKLIAAVAQPFALEAGREVLVTLSIGISLGPQDSADAAELLHRADAAMYLAKQRGKNRYVLYADAFEP